MSFTTSPLVHAGDDRSVMESLEALPYIAESARAIAGEKPIAVGPSAIGMRDNPYGAAPMPNPSNIRQAMSRNDPRQRGLFGAAWNLGYFARFAYGGVASVALGGAGPFSIVHSREEWQQPWFDENGGLFPVFHVMQGLSALVGRPLLSVDIDRAGEVQGIAAKEGAGAILWLANLTSRPQQIELAGLVDAEVMILDSKSFVLATSNERFFDTPATTLTNDSLELSPYAVARVAGR